MLSSTNPVLRTGLLLNPRLFPRLGDFLGESLALIALGAVGRELVRLGIPLALEGKFLAKRVMEADKPVHDVLVLEGLWEAVGVVDVDLARGVGLVILARLRAYVAVVVDELRVDFKER